MGKNRDYIYPYEDIVEGKILNSSFCGEFEIVCVRNYQEVKIRFLTTGKEYWKTKGQLRRGYVADPYFPTVYGKGYLGEGRYKTKINGVPYKPAYVWKHMLGRVYNEDNDRFKRYTSYLEGVCEEWLNMQNFCAWYEDQTKHLGDSKGYHLDKDLKLGKVYSPENCVIIPQELNIALVCKVSSSGKYLTGVTSSRGEGFRARVKRSVGEGNKLVYSKAFTTQEEAHEEYAKMKKTVLMSLAKKLLNEGKISEDIYALVENLDIKALIEHKNPTK